MKRLFLLLLLLSSFALSSQAQDTFDRKGKFSLETGYNIVGGFSTGTGLGLIFDESGESLTSLGVDAGYFVGKDLVIKGSLGLIASSGESFFSFKAGAKYYLLDYLPIELLVGTLSAGDVGTFQASIQVGYAIRLASNIYLEPSLGALFVEDGSIGTGDISFVMMF